MSRPLDADGVPVRNDCVCFIVTFRADAGTDAVQTSDDQSVAHTPGPMGELPVWVLRVGDGARGSKWIHLIRDQLPAFYGWGVLVDLVWDSRSGAG